MGSTAFQTSPSDHVMVTAAGTCQPCGVPISLMCWPKQHAYCTWKCTSTFPACCRCGGSRGGRVELLSCTRLPGGCPRMSACKCHKIVYVYTIITRSGFGITEAVPVCAPGQIAYHPPTSWTSMLSRSCSITSFFTATALYLRRCGLLRLVVLRGP